MGSTLATIKIFGHGLPGAAGGHNQTDRGKPTFRELLAISF